MKVILRHPAVFALLVFCVPVFSQATAFKYQGSLTDGGAAANGTYQMQFRLFDAASGGTQVGPVLSNVPATAANGVFTVTLDFGSSPLTGAARWLEISVRRNSNEAYVTLSPREQITASPYAVRTISAQTADVALDSQKLGGVNADQFVQTADPRMTDARNPLPNSTNYIQNQNVAPQAATSFNISGNGTAASFNANGPLTFAGTGTPAAAPPGQGRLFFDTATNRLKVSENGSPYVNLTGATGVAGSGSVGRVPLWSAGATLGDSNIFQTGGNVGVGTATPGSGLEVRGSGVGAQQRITDAASGNSLVLQGGAGSDMKVTGYNYGTQTPQPLHLSTDGANTYMNAAGGSVGIGTVAPENTLDVNGFIRAYNTAGGNVVSETKGGVNSWAKFWARTPVQTWSIGSSNNFNGNQLYFANETNGLIRMAIMPGGNVGIGTTNPLSGLEVSGTGLAAQQRITDTASGNSLVLQGGAGGNMKVTGYNYSTNQPVPISLSSDGASTSVGGNLDVAGYLKIKSITSLPPASDCSQPSHYGRMVVLNPGGSAGSQVYLFVCFQGGFTAVYP
jgi:hypothetical protein